MSKRKQEMRISELQELLGDKYKILKKIGSGGFGEVYLGEHAALGRKVAIKILLESFASQDELVKRFQREARAAATLQHPNIIDIYDVGEAEGIFFFVMKYIEGDTLAIKMEHEKRIAQPEAIHIMKQVADALDYAHEHNVIHRDIKPANIMLDQFGKPVLMDFGVARITYEGNLTKTGTLMGTPHYLAPEQPLGKTVDRRSDIYSLGILLYEMLAGKPPFHDENSITLIFKHINEQATPLEKLAPEADPHLVAVITKMIAKSPDDRYQTAAEVVDELEGLAEIYPVKTTLTGRRSTPASARNTEKLLLLAQEHLQQDKISRAIEIFKAIKERSPENERAKQETDALIAKLKERFLKRVTDSEFAPARMVLAQLEQLMTKEEMVPLRVELDKSEASMASSTRSMPAINVSALRASGFSADNENLATIHKPAEEGATIADQVEETVAKKIDALIEQLKFEDASTLIRSIRSRFPEMAERKSSGLQDAQDLHQKLNKAKNLMETDKLEEAEMAFDDFLQAPPMFDYQILYKLRKEGENLHGQNRKMLFNEYMDLADRYILKKEFEKARDPLEKILAKDKNYAPAVRKWKDLEDRQFGDSMAVPPAPVEPSKPADVIAPTPANLAQTQQKPAKKSPLLAIVILVVLAAAVGFFLWQKMHSPEPTTTALPPSTVQPVKPQIVPPVVPPPPTSGKVTVSSEPEGATILLDGVEKGVTPLDLNDVPFGPHSVKLQLKGYKDSDQNVDLSLTNVAVEVPAVLEPETPLVGSVVVDSTPGQAEIYIGKKMVGVTPKTITNLGPGTYKLVIRKQGFQDFSGPVHIKEGETASLNAALVQAEAITPAQPAEPELKPGTLVELGPDVIPPQAIKKVSPRYTDAIKEKKLSGTVKVNVLVSETGKVLDAKVLESVNPLLDDLALKAALEWTYVPATKKGVPVKVWIPLSFTFVQK